MDARFNQPAPIPAFDPAFDEAFATAAFGLADSISTGLSQAVSEALADPIVQALMAADCVDRTSFEALLRRMTARLGNCRPRSGQRCAG